MTTFEIVRDLVLLSLGVAGTALSVYNFYDIRRRSSRKLQVSFSTVIPTYLEQGLGEPILQVTTTNLGQRNVTVTNLGIELPQRRTLASLRSSHHGIDDTPTPVTLSDGEIANRHFSYSEIAKAIRGEGMPAKIKLKAFAVDSVGKRHYGDNLSFDANQW